MSFDSSKTFRINQLYCGTYHFASVCCVWLSEKHVLRGYSINTQIRMLNAILNKMRSESHSLGHLDRAMCAVECFVGVFCYQK